MATAIMPAGEANRTSVIILQSLFYNYGSATIHYETVGWNEPIDINGVKVSLHPAGHIIGSSQVRVEYKGEVWVISGDYKTENDGIKRCIRTGKMSHIYYRIHFRSADLYVEKTI